MGKKHPVRKNQFNFSTISFRYYKDAFARLEAFKAGEFDFIHENTSKIWARSYKGKSFVSGAKVKEELRNSNPAGMQGYVFNTRKSLFSDFRVRKAIYLAMDFEWMNRQLFYDQYKRSYSFFTILLWLLLVSPLSLRLSCWQNLLKSPIYSLIQTSLT